MDGNKYSAYNLSRNTVLSSKVVVADAELDPLKVLSLWIDRLGFDPDAALWLKPISGIPEVPRIFSFDIVYLDRNYRVIDSAVVVPGIEIPPYRRQVTSALILPERRLSSTQTQRGDKILLHLRDEDIQEREPDGYGVSNTAAEVRSLQQQTAIESIVIERKTGAESPYEQFPSPLIYMPSITTPGAGVAGVLEEELWKAAVATPDNFAEAIGNTQSVVEEAGTSTDCRVLAGLESIEIIEPQVETQSAAGTKEFAGVIADQMRRIPAESTESLAQSAAKASSALKLGEEATDEKEHESLAPLPKEDALAESGKEAKASHKGPRFKTVNTPISPPNATQFTLSQASGWNIDNHAKVVPIDRSTLTQTKAPAQKASEEKVQKTQPRVPLVPTAKSVRSVTEPERPKVEPINQPAEGTPALAQQRARLGPLPPEVERAAPVPLKAPLEIEPRRSFTERILHWLESGQSEGANRRKTKRVHAPGIVAFYWSGAASKPYQVANISMGGCYLLTDHPWSRDTIVRMTLQAHVHTHGPSMYSITVLARVVRIDEDGAGYQFVMTDALKRITRDFLPRQGTDKKALERFLKPLFE